MQLTKNFNSAEFDCKDGTPVPEKYMDNVQKLAENLQVLRNELGVPVHVFSGYRTARHNKTVGGKKNSQHLYAKAADIVVKKFTPYMVQEIIERLIGEGKMAEGGLGKYKTFTHYDCRKKPARW